MNYDLIKKNDNELYTSLMREETRQNGNIELIASENFVSDTVCEAVGSLLTNKYAEGYPGKRYYGGCQFIDEIEEIARERAKKLFGADHANVQPHSGSNANFGVYFSVLNPGDKILGMDLTQGGHLTHGSPVNMSGKYYEVAHYGVRKDTERIDYEALRAQALEFKPKIIVAGASAYSRIIDFKIFKEIADEVGAYLLVDMAHIAGLVATGLHPSPIPYADFVTTTTHKTLRGPRGGMILCKKEHKKKIDKSIFPGIQGGPLEHVIAGKAVCFKEAMSDDFKIYQQNVVNNAHALADALMDRDFRLVSGGTDNHLMLVDLTNKGITGKDAEKLLDEINITANKNTIPYETLSPFVTSGLRIGTPACTTRGLVKDDMVEIASIIDEVITKKEASNSLRGRVAEITGRYKR